MDEAEERRHIERSRRGEPDAFEPLVEGHQGWALAYAGAMLGAEDDAADAVQDAFVRAYRSLSDLEPGRPFGPWFRAILRNRCLDELRSARTRREVRDRDGRPAEEAMSPARGRGEEGRSAPRGPELVEREELGRIVRAGLAELSDDKRAALVLKEMEGMSYEEIAGELDVPPGTVASRLHHARRELRRVLEERGLTAEDLTA